MSLRYLSVFIVNTIDIQKASSKHIVPTEAEIWVCFDTSSGSALALAREVAGGVEYLYSVVNV